MKNDKKTIFVYVVEGYNNYTSFLSAKFNVSIVYDIQKANIVLFPGGADVTPMLYKCAPHSTTVSDSVSDRNFLEAFREVKHNDNILKLGICKGSQFLCAMSGGRLVQNISGHALMGYHDIKTIDNKVLKITSTHHQMAYPYNMPVDNYKIIAWATPARSNYYEGANIFWNHNIYEEPEIVFYPKINSLGIQGHPENMDVDSETVTYLCELINTYLK